MRLTNFILSCALTEVGFFAGKAVSDYPYTPNLFSALVPYFTLHLKKFKECTEQGKTVEDFRHELDDRSDLLASAMTIILRYGLMFSLNMEDNTAMVAAASLLILIAQLVDTFVLQQQARPVAQLN